MQDEPRTSGPRSIRWEAVDPFVAGPQSRSVGAGSRPFAVPADPARELLVGRLRSGPGWPAALPAVDRLAAAPVARPEDVVRARAGRAVLVFELPGADPIPLCATSPEGGVHWSVDPVEWICGVLAEAYVSRWTRPLTSRIPLLNYARIPHVLKRALQGLQSPVSGYRSRPVAFPLIPLDDLVEVIRRVCASLAAPAASIAPEVWPRGRHAAVTVTHDVDTDWILDDRRASLLREIVDTETSLGYRGAWYVTADRLSTARHERALQTLADAGHEIGAHGWNHDSKLLYLSARRQELRIRRIRERFAGLELEGIRTPWYGRSERLFRILARHFRYDSSVPTASGFFSSHTNSGCCSLFPYRTASGLVELPMTLPPDTALASDSGYDELLACSEKIIDRGGVVVITMHPQPHQSARPPALARYFRFLERLAERCGDEAWHATPGDIVRHYEAHPPRPPSPPRGR